MGLFDLFRSPEGIIKKQLAILNKKFCSNLSYARVQMGIEDLKNIPLGEKNDYTQREEFYELLLKTWYCSILDDHSKSVAKGVVEELGADMAIASFEVFSDALTNYLIVQKILKNKKKYGGNKKELADLYEEAIKKYNKKKKKKGKEIEEEAEEKEKTPREREKEEEKEEAEKEKDGPSKKEKSSDKEKGTREKVDIEDDEISAEKEEKQKKNSKNKTAEKEKSLEAEQEEPEEEKKKETEIPHVVPTENVNMEGIKDEATIKAERENEHYEYLRFLQRYHPEMLGGFSGFVPDESFSEAMKEINAKNEGNPKGKDKDLEEYFRRQQREKELGGVAEGKGNDKPEKEQKPEKEGKEKEQKAEKEGKEKEQKPEKAPKENAPKREKIDAFEKHEKEPTQKEKSPKMESPKQKAPTNEPHYKDLENDAFAKKINETFKEPAPLFAEDEPQIAPQQIAPIEREMPAPGIKK